MVVAAVVVGTDLLLILLARVEEHVKGECEKDKMENRPSERKAGPVVAVLHDVKAVTVKFDITIKVHVVKGPNWDLVAAAPFFPVFFLLKRNVVLDRTTRQLGVRVYGGRVGRDDSPEGNQNGQEQDNEEENCGLEAAAQTAGDNGGDSQ